MTGTAVTGQLPIPALCKTIRALVSKGDSSTVKGEQFYIAAGRYLAELKERRPGDVVWAVYVEQKCKISRSRADELIQIADGRTSVEKSRAGKAASQAKTTSARKAAASGGGKQSSRRNGSDRAVVDTADDPIQETCTDCDTPEQFWQRSAGNLAGDAISMRAYWTRQFGDGWENFEVTSQLAALATQAAEVWKTLAKEFEKRRKS